MAKMNKEQSKQFENLFETTVCWGDDENCNGLFVELLDSSVDHETHNLYYLTTCVQEDNNQIEILEFDGSGYYDLVGYIPINSKAKATMKKIVNCLLDGGSFSDLRDISGIE
ncbi:hypothetical protein 65p361 [Aeromonas phage 65]|uniref:Uncharacterized protein n=2 Tax=Ishigurovirus osborne TaxID=260149 RepID=A0A219YCK8_9CAUD|nr:hypothetical protein ST65p361 [Aeromonas phage 65]ADQ53369.1 hypothetical protein 65p361 [Aeromonas phage 65]APU01728.1 hypothetical protein [Aeromonas phage 65.2]